jgi:hypothetical protein
LGGITCTSNNGNYISWAYHNFDYICELKINTKGLPDVTIYFDSVIMQMLDHGNEKAGRKLMAKLYTLSGELIAHNIKVRGE